MTFPTSVIRCVFYSSSTVYTTPKLLSTYMQLSGFNECFKIPYFLPLLTCTDVSKKDLKLISIA